MPHTAKSMKPPSNIPILEQWLPGDSIPTHDWQKLKDESDEALQELQQNELLKWKRAGDLHLLYEAWAKLGQKREEGRAKKRLHTRIAYVEIKSERLAASQTKYLAARSAFESALDQLHSKDA